MLSNNHVLANSNRATAGDPILQPGRHDRGLEPADVVGHLYDFVPLLDQGQINEVDCAVATIAPGIRRDSTPLSSPAMQRAVRPSSVLIDIEDETEIIKSGRTTGVTVGKVRATEVDNVIIDYGTPQRPMLCRFDNQISGYSAHAAFAKRGDSGSIVTTFNGEAVGLVFAVSENGGPSGVGLTYMNPFHRVLDALDAELWLD